MTSHPGIGKGLNTSMMLGALGLSAIGAFFAYVGLFTNHGVRLGMIPIPLSIVGPLLVLGGLVLLAMSFSQPKCLSCSRSLESASAYFPADEAARVKQAVERVDTAAITTANPGTPAQNHVMLSLDYCDQCKSIAIVDVDVFRPDRESLIAKRTIAGPPVGAFVDQIKARDEAHEQASED